MKFVPNFKILGQVVPEKSLTKISIFIILEREKEKVNQSRTNGPINAQVMPRYNHNNETQKALL